MRVTAGRRICAGILISDFAKQGLIIGQRRAASERQRIGGRVPARRNAVPDRAILHAADKELVTCNRIPGAVRDAYGRADKIGRGGIGDRGSGGEKRDGGTALNCFDRSRCDLDFRLDFIDRRVDLHQSGPSDSRIVHRQRRLLHHRFDLRGREVGIRRQNQRRNAGEARRGG